MSQNIEPEPHAFGTFAPPGVEFLIIGTFPTHKRNREFEFFYPNKQNVFWEIVASIYKYNFQRWRINDVLKAMYRIDLIGETY
jgi:G:T/U-mismatch repair DNA glycosylase